MLPEEDLQFPFGKDQFECLPFRSVDGFGAIFLDLIEGFAANANGTTAIFIQGSTDSYNCTESVPQLVKRFNFFMEKRRLREKVVVSPERPSTFVPVVSQGVQHAEQAPETRPVEEALEATEASAADSVVLTPAPAEEVPVSPPPAKSFPFRVPSRA